MTPTTLSSAEFKQHIGAAKKAARLSEVFITERGQPAYVLLSHAHYRRLAGRRAQIPGNPDDIARFTRTD